MNRKKGILFIICLIIFVVGFVIQISKPIANDNARERSEKFIQAVNNNRPDLVYDFLTPEIQGLISKEGFKENFAKERSYPYLTPLYLYLDRIDFGEDKSNGTIHCIVASRLPGEKMTFEIILIDGKYYIEAFRAVADGSFIEKFDRL